MERVHRRRFLSSAGAASIGLTTGLASENGLSKPASDGRGTRSQLKLGCQSAPTNDTHLKYLARYGIRNICGYPEIAEGRVYATVDELSRMRDLAEKNGITVDCTAPPFLESSHIP